MCEYLCVSEQAGSNREMTALLPVSHSSRKYKDSIPRKQHPGFINTFTTGKKLSGRRQNEAATGTHTWTGCCCWYYHCGTLPAPWREICQEICCNNPAPGSGLISSHSGLSNEANSCQLFKLYDIPAFLSAGKPQQDGSWELHLPWDCCERLPCTEAWGAGQGVAAAEQHLLSGASVGSLLVQILHPVLVSNHGVLWMLQHVWRPPQTQHSADGAQCCRGLSAGA